MKTKLLSVLLVIFAFSLNAQDWPRLNVTVKKSFNPQSSFIFIEPMMPDYLLAVEILKKTFSLNEYKVVDDRTKADFVLTMAYNDRDDHKCAGGRAIKKLEGKIFNAKGTGETMVLFNFGQSPFETKCADEIFTALSKKIKSEMLKK